MNYFDEIKAAIDKLPKAPPQPRAIFVGSALYKAFKESTVAQAAGQNGTQVPLTLFGVPVIEHPFLSPNGRWVDYGDDEESMRRSMRESLP